MPKKDLKEQEETHIQSLMHRDNLRDLLLYMATMDFYTYVRMMAPLIVPGFIDGRHIKLICDELQWAFETDDARLMIFASPGSMKSLLGSVLFPTWVYGKAPDNQILHVSHTADFTANFGGKIRDIMSMEEYKAIFPETRLNPKYQARDLWETTKRGVYRSAGVNGAITGKRGHFGIADDLVTEHTVGSKTEMEKIYTWWPQGFESRLLPKGRIILINTRWSLMDPSSWLLKRAEEGESLDQWRVVSLPAILTEEAAEMLNRVGWDGKDLQPGESYWPEFWPTKDLLKKKRGMPESQWLALYMQNPIALDGNIIKTENFKTWLDNGAEVTHVVASIDTAFSTSNQADYSVIQIWGVFYTDSVSSDGKEYKKGNLLLLEEIRGRLEYPDLVKACEDIKKDRDPDIWIIEKKASGQSLIQDLRRKGFFIHEYLPDKDKLSRAIACTPFINDGRIWLPDRLFSQDFKDEFAAFPKGAHDDRVDATTMAILWLRDNFYLTYETEDSLEDLEEERQSRVAGKRYYW